MQFVTAILAIAKAIPIIDSWLQKLVVAYTNSQITSMKQEDIDAIKAAIEKQDQRALESAMGSTKTGEMSDVNGSVLVDKLPGVK
jgi:hypothetical protein